MGFPVNTSAENWQQKVTELYKSRTSISIIDDSGYGRTGIMQAVSRLKTLNSNEKSFVILFYFLAIICGISLWLSAHTTPSKPIVITLSAAGVILFSAIPTYQLAKNRAPIIENTEEGIDIRFI